MSPRAIAASAVLVVALAAAAFLLLSEAPSEKGPRLTGTPVASGPATPEPTTAAPAPSAPWTPSPSPGPSSVAPTPPVPTPAATPAPSGSFPPTPTPFIDPRFASRRRVSVKVDDPSGKPVPGARISASPWPKGVTWSTDKEGVATFDVPPKQPVKGTARHPRFEDRPEWSIAPDGERATIRFARPLAVTGRINGWIHDPDGNVKSEPVLHLLPEGETEEHLLSGDGLPLEDGVGNVRVDAGVGRYTLWVTAPGYSASEKSYATVVANGACGPFDFLLVKQGRIGGRVVLPRHLELQREPPAIVFTVECVRGTVENPHTTRRQVRQRLGEGGTFVLDDLDAGTYRVRAEVADDPSWQSSWVGVKLDAGTRIEGMALKVEGAQASARGLVRDRKGGAIAGATVTPTAAGTSGATTDEQGRFELRGLDPGKHEVAVEKEGYVRAVLKVEVLPAGAPPANVDVVLDRRGSATGTVRRAGKPAAGVTVLLVLKVPGGGVKPAPAAKTDASGAYRVTELEPGSYYVKVGEGADDPFTETGAPGVEVVGGEEARVPDLTVP